MYRDYRKIQSVKEEYDTTVSNLMSIKKNSIKKDGIRHSAKRV